MTDILTRLAALTQIDGDGLLACRVVKESSGTMVKLEQATEASATTDGSALET
ncbi:MAG: hypothetical protein ABI693_33850 [Bryobacteraceae bacterium]